MNLVPEPCAVVSGKQYHLWLQFEGGQAVHWPGRLSAYQARNQRDETIEQFRDQNASAIVEHDGLAIVVRNLGPENDVTAYVWVSEVS